MNINPWARLIFKVFLTVLIGISAGTVSIADLGLTHVKMIVAWCGFLAFVMSAVSNVFDGISATATGQIASLRAVLPEATIVTTKEIANSPAFKDDTKVVSKIS